MQWSKKEEQLLKSLNKTILEKDEIKKLFPNRSIISIIKKSKLIKIKFSIKRHHHLEWSLNEIQILKEKYKKSSKKEIEILLPNRKYENITQKYNSLFKDRKKTRWSAFQLDFLKKYYYDLDKQILIKTIKKTWDAIKLKAAQLTLKRSYDFARKSDLSVLLQETNLKYYWLGFLLADGHYNNINKRIHLTLAKKDTSHVEKFAKFINCKNITYNKTNTCIAAQNKDILPEFCLKYEISNNKTINAPKIENYGLSDDNFLSLFIGFVDGDGNINNVYKRLDCSLRIKCYKTWLENFKYFENKLYSIFPLSKKNNLAKINNQGYAYIGFSNNKLLKSLKAAVIRLDLPVLTRKWDKIKL